MHEVCDSDIDGEFDMIEDLSNRAMWASGNHSVFRSDILSLSEALNTKLVKNKKEKKLN